MATEHAVVTLERIANKSLLESLENAIVCKICLDVVQNGVQCSKCDAKFCRPHLTDWKQKDNTCPNCREASQVLALDRGLQAIINTLQLHCRFKDRGCEVVKAANAIAHHEGECSKARLSEAAEGEAGLEELMGEAQERATGACRECRYFAERATDEAAVVERARDRNNQLMERLQSGC